MRRNPSVVDSVFRLSLASPAPTGAPRNKRNKAAIEPYEVIAPTEVRDEHDAERPEAAALIHDLEQQVQQKDEALRKCLEQLLQKDRLVARLQREMLEDKRALRDCEKKLASRKREPTFTGTLEEMFKQAEEQIRQERMQRGEPPPPAPAGGGGPVALAPGGARRRRRTGTRNGNHGHPRQDLGPVFGVEQRLTPGPRHLRIHPS